MAGVVVADWSSAASVTGASRMERSRLRSKARQEGRRMGFKRRFKRRAEREEAFQDDLALLDRVEKASRERMAKTGENPARFWFASTTRTGTSRSPRSILPRT